MENNNRRLVFAGRFTRSHFYACVLVALAVFVLSRGSHAESMPSFVPIDISPPDCDRFDDVVISPDDQKIAFGLSPGTVWVVGIDGANPRLLRFSPDE